MQSAITIRGILLLSCVFGIMMVHGIEDVRPTGEPEECKCQFPKHDEPSSKFWPLLRPLCGKRFEAEDDLTDGYKYSVGICASAELRPAEKYENAGAIQIKKGKQSGDGGPQKYSIGSFLQTEIMTGNDWMLLEYEGGDNFGSHCSKEGRRTVIMILCTPGETEGKLSWVEENRNKSSDCYYLFELSHEAACAPSPPAPLSTGSIICIVFFSIAGVYFIGGVLYMRLVRNAKGLRQIPNYDFWRDFGALQADGCDLVCRCGSKTSEPEANNYHGIGDHQIDTANDGEYDDHLLPM